MSETSSYDYSSYTASSKDTNLSGQTISSTTSGASAVYITSSGITISNSQINKSGDVASGSTEDSEFYGVNAAILVNGGGLTMTDGSITTSATGGNALVATNGGTVTGGKTILKADSGKKFSVQIPIDSTYYTSKGLNTGATKYGMDLTDNFEVKIVTTPNFANPSTSSINGTITSVHMVKRGIFRIN